MMDAVSKHLAKRVQCFIADRQRRINSNAAIKFLYDCIEQNKLEVKDALTDIFGDIIETWG